MIDHDFYMQRALELGQKGRLTAPPNPWIGCVIVNHGVLVGEGFHKCVGQPHAEIEALQQAGQAAQGATAYVTLEPCAHFGRTPPCVDALIKAGIRQVVIPFTDPDPKVAGQGVRRLKEKNIDVITGVQAHNAAQALEPYLFQRRTGLPFCVLKAAVSVDGRTAAADGSSQWITGERARENAHLLRAESQAILIGSSTAIMDNPKLTVRGMKKGQYQPPLRVVLDARGRWSAQGHLCDQSEAKTLIFTSKLCPQERMEQWQAKGIEVAVIDCDEQRKLDLAAVLHDLGQKTILQLMVEGGASIHASFLAKELWNLFILYMGSCILGPQGRPLIPELACRDISQAPRWQLKQIQQLENDIRLDYSRLT